MTQQQQQDFTTSLQEVQSWIQAVHDRLKATDSTHGPLEALEARLRETENLHQSQHEGQLKMDRALVCGDRILQSGDQDLRNSTQAKIKELKHTWEEITTYITHCHSRLEWVWLHWIEYLKALEEFQLWLRNQQCRHSLALELQLGLKEKLWQVDQQRVVVSDVHSMEALLERLLAEATMLHSSTKDPGLDPQAQEKLKEAYRNVKKNAEERLSQLQDLSEEHQKYQGCVHKFQSWLVSTSQKLTDLMEGDNPPEDKLQDLQSLDVHSASEESTLQHIEGMAEDVQVHTSPAGATLVVEEAEELRVDWHRLRRTLCEAEDGLRCRLDSHAQYMVQRQRLQQDVADLQALLQGLEKDLGASPAETEEQVLDNWRRFTEVKRTLSEVEAQVELLKAQLKDLFRASKDTHPLSEDVLSVVKQYQSVKCRASKLCAESESQLRIIFQEPLMVYTQWSHRVSRVLESSAKVTDFSHIAMLVQQIECLHRESLRLQDLLRVLRTKAELVQLVLGPENADALQSDLSMAIKNQELLHTQLLQRRSRLEVLITRTKDFGESIESIQSKLSRLEDRVAAADVLQPDILAKKSQLDQFRAVETELDECEAQIAALEALGCSSRSDRAQLDRLLITWRRFQHRVKAKVLGSEENVADHETFHESLLNIQKLLMVMKQKLESFQDLSGDWSIQGRCLEVERALGELPEMELQVQQVEVQGLRVQERTSEDGQVHIVQDLKCLQESWLSLSNTRVLLQRQISSSSEQEAGLPPPHREGPAGALAVMAPQGEWVQVHGEGRVLNECPGVGEDGAACWTGDEGDTSPDVSREGRALSAPASSEEQRGVSREESAEKTPAPPRHTQGHSGSKRRGFEAWLSEENSLLSEILNNRMSTQSVTDMQTAEDTLAVLRSRVSWGQQQLELLLEEGGGDEDDGLEDLRYRWMLYKSKLKESGKVRQRSRAKKPAAKHNEPDLTDRIQKRPGVLQRVCVLALPLSVLFLLLLLMLLLLPVMDQGSSCSVSNNFARSFNLMLRYQGPPPT